MLAKSRKSYRRDFARNIGFIEPNTIYTYLVVKL